MKYLSSLPENTAIEILSQVDGFVKAWHTKNAETFGQVFTEDAEFTDIVNQIARGRDQIISQHHFPFATVNKSAIFVIDNLYMRSISDGLVLVTGEWKLTGALTPKGDPIPDRNGVLQIICRGENTGWKISLVHNTDMSQVYSKMVETHLRFYTTK